MASRYSKPSRKLSVPGSRSLLLPGKPPSIATIRFASRSEGGWAGGTGLRVMSATNAFPCASSKQTPSRAHRRFLDPAWLSGRYARTLPDQSPNRLRCGRLHPVAASRYDNHYSRYDEKLQFSSARRSQLSFWQAASKLSTRQVVSSIERRGATPGGACTFWGSTAHSASAPSDFLLFLGCKLTRAKRTSKRATRTRCLPCRGT